MKDLNWLEFTKRIYYILGFIVFVLVCGEASDHISHYMHCRSPDNMYLDRCYGNDVSSLVTSIGAIISAIIGPFIGWKVIEWVLSGLKKKAD